MVIFGLLGYYMRKADFPTAAVVLAMILGGMAERGFRQSLIMSKGNVLAYYAGRPICIILLVLIIIGIITPIIMQKRSKETSIAIDD
jgi:putative tricarboxylic transport membrane protein